MIKTPYCDTGEGAQGLVGVHTVEDICISTMMEYIVSSLICSDILASMSANTQKPYNSIMAGNAGMADEIRERKY